MVNGPLVRTTALGEVRFQGLRELTPATRSRSFGIGLLLNYVLLFKPCTAPYLWVSAVSEIAELPAQVVVEVGGDGLGLRVPGSRPLSVVTVTAVAEAVRVSVVAIAVQMTVPVAVVGVSVKER